MAGESPIDVRRLIDVTIGTSSSGRETNTITLGPQANRPVYVYSTITGMRMPAVYTVFNLTLRLIRAFYFLVRTD